MRSGIHIAALVSYQVFPAKMGGQKGIARFYEHLSSRIKVTIVSTKNNEYPESLSADFFPLLSNSRLRYINPFLIFRLNRFIKSQKITHLILEHPYYGWLGIILKYLCKVQLIVHSHNIESLRFKSTGKWWWGILWQYEKFTHQQADISFFITDEDRLFAVKKYKLNASKCHTITYGFDLNDSPPKEIIQASRLHLQELHGIMPYDKILFFNGTLDYKPNLDALDVILNKLNPLLKKNVMFPYKIIICGKNLPPQYNNLLAFSNENIIYAGFVNDITTYFNGADIFINPVVDGGGIKTKLVEALGAGLSAVSTTSGAIGVNTVITGKKLVIVPDDNWQDFVEGIWTSNIREKIPERFFDHFYWGNIAQKAAKIIEGSSIKM